MNIRFLGRWSSNVIPGERNVSFVLDDAILFDCGPHTVASLLDGGMDPCRIELMLISHMHMDHFAGVPELMWYRSIYKAENRLTVIGPAGITEATRSLLRLTHTPDPWYGEQIETHVEFKEDTDTDSVRIYHAHHTIPDNAYRVEHRGGVIFYSGDTTYCSAVAEGARNADLLVHEMTYTDEDAKLAEFWCHSTYSDAMRVFRESKAKRLIPVHLTRASSALVSRLAGTEPGLVYPPDTLEL